MPTSSTNWPDPVGNPWGETETPFAAIGGEEAVRRLVDVFYDRVEATSPVLRAMLPESLDETREKLTAFMVGWLGGPPRYVERFGHPQLRMRHFPFSIGEVEAEEWMRCMRVAFTDCALDPVLAGFLDGRLEGLARHLINRADS